MHNLISFNQLAEWKHFEETLDKCNDELDLINDYYNCLIECDDDQVTCKRVCRRILQQSNWGLTTPLFLSIIKLLGFIKKMDREKLKLLVRNLELLVDSLKAEVYSDTQSYLNYEEVKTGLHDYDEIFDDDDGYPD